ncbi:MAG: DUF86 domain-containing protein [Candidatus Bathyarchaeia archaeon]
MKRDPRLYLDDIFDAIEKIESYVEGLSFEEFSADSKTVDAIVRNFEIIGEATKRISLETKEKYPQIPWKMMAGTRDKLIHEYFGVNLQVLWMAVKEDLPPVKGSIKSLLEKMDKEF